MSAPATPVGLRVEHHHGSPLAVGVAAPRLSWRTETDVAGWVQAAWEVEADDDRGRPLWHSGRQGGRDAVLVPWGGDPLPSRTRCSWRVRVWGEDGSGGEWSEPAAFEVGLLDAGDWSAAMIAPAWDEPVTLGQPAPHLRTTFAVDEAIASARLHITALGVYEATLNGERVGDHVLAPGWTSYHHRLCVQTFDVTELVARGPNTLEAVVADGWYRGNLGFDGQRDVYGDRTALLAQLEIVGDDGSVEVIATGEDWQAAPGPVRAADFYDGETFDARVSPEGWTPVQVLGFDTSVLVPQVPPPVRVTEVVRPIAVTRSPSGRTIVDFGQNLVGVVRLRVEGAAGTTVTLRHAEVLEDGELCTRILRSAQATDRYTLAGTGVEEWHPRFTFHGFRYVEVSGWPGELRLEDIEALVWHTDMTRTGWFTCSDPRVNRLHDNIVWGWRGNTVSVPTDCPQRDERLGWTGDLQVFAPTACFLYDAAGFLDGWLADLRDEQLADGCVPAVIPDVLGDRVPIHGAGWGDAATVVPTVVHEWYADEALLRRQLDSMVAWVRSIDARAGADRLWTRDLQFGDWVDPTVNPNTPHAARTDPDFVATAYFAHSADLVARAARVLGEADTDAAFTALAAEVRAALRHEWVAPSGRVVADTQTGCALALAFDLVDDGDRRVVGDRLRQLVRNEGHRVATGFLGTPLLLPALCAAGHLGDAYRMLLQTEPPSWLYAVLHGATTIWERWDALRPDGSLNAGVEMLSFNHYAFGAVGEWLHATVGGLTPLEPGFRRFRVAPRPGRNVTSATMTFDSPHGRIVVDWSLAGRGIELLLVVPANTTAEVHLPARGGDPVGVGSGEHRFRYAVDTDAYRAWVPGYRVDTPIDELRADPDAWAVVMRHCPDLEPSPDPVLDHSLVEVWRRRGLPLEALGVVAHELKRVLRPVPPPPDELGVG